MADIGTRNNAHVGVVAAHFVVVPDEYPNAIEKRAADVIVDRRFGDWQRFLTDFAAVAAKHFS